MVLTRSRANSLVSEDSSRVLTTTVSSVTSANPAAPVASTQCTRSPVISGTADDTLQHSVFQPGSGEIGGVHTMSRLPPPVTTVAPAEPGVHSVPPPQIHHIVSTTTPVATMQATATTCPQVPIQLPYAMSPAAFYGMPAWSTQTHTNVSPSMYAPPYIHHAPIHFIPPDGYLPSPTMPAPVNNMNSHQSYLDGASNTTASAAPTPLVITDGQLAQIVSALRTQPASVGGNFARCTARFDGTGDIQAFVDAILIYKECVSISDEIALRGIPMLLTGFAATWWQGIKHSVTTWNEAIQLLQGTYGVHLPPHKVYRRLFEREQGDEATDIFVTKARALISQLPPNTLSEETQLDMVYGLLSCHIREKVPRTSFSSFAELLQKARIVEELYAEGQQTPVTATMSTPSKLTFSTPAAASKGPVMKKTRPRCGYCKQFGHKTEGCPKGQRQRGKQEGNTKEYPPPPTITCYGCGAPGVIRSNCPTCKKRPTTPVTASTSSTAFQSVAALGNKDITHEHARNLMLRYMKQSIASKSLYTFLRTRNHVFSFVNTTVKLADGSSKLMNVATTKVDVKVQGIIIPTVFIVLPDATDSLLGMNFIQEAGMILNFERHLYTLKSDSRHFNLRYEAIDPVGEIATASAIVLRDEEGAFLSASERESFNTLLHDNRDIFEPGGAPTTFAVHRIDTGEHAPVAVPPYRVSPWKKEIMRKEIERMLEEEFFYRSRV
ncbi:uncharacterized protein LOC113514129 [Galleria mellonella]|uniref:Uncharacterized protein LOC113514129 n=1 Tax=Galleria mellonella TaxID=7137 RepID=A0ABM3MXW4_GALME|nr:uncharacterized protein LOC113514129 [Galleria mellonella]